MGRQGNLTHTPTSLMPTPCAMQHHRAAWEAGPTLFGFGCRKRKDMHAMLFGWGWDSVLWEHCHTTTLPALILWTLQPVAHWVLASLPLHTLLPATLLPAHTTLYTGAGQPAVPALPHLHLPGHCDYLPAQCHTSPTTTSP